MTIAKIIYHVDLTPVIFHSTVPIVPMQEVY